MFGDLGNDYKNSSPNIDMLVWRWWRGVDKYLLMSVALLSALGVLLVTTASSAVASRIGVPNDYFSVHHLVYLLISIIVMLIFSCMKVSDIKLMCLFGFLVTLGLLAFVKFYGYEIKGARRWVNLFGFSMQPSEFIKPFFAVVTAMIFDDNKRGFGQYVNFDNRIVMHGNAYKRLLYSLMTYALVASLLILQPDFGMLMTLTGIWGMQLFVGGLPIFFVIMAFVVLCAGIGISYLMLPHVADRINSFLDADGAVNYQAGKSLLAFMEGGALGKGPGEGVIKYSLPDSHADFIFAVAGEEFGAVLCILISMVFCFIVVRGMLRLSDAKDRFVLIASVGILAQIGLQSVINMGVAIHLLPTKGMTLPFISYGGTSYIAMSMSVGILLAISKNVVQYNVPTRLV